MEQLKIDLSKTDAAYYKVSKEPDIRELDAYYYLTIQGKSSPEDQRFMQAIEAIYTVAYAIKFLCKGEDNDFTVPKMECFWYVEGGPEVQHKFTQTPRDQWMWKIVIRMPDIVDQNHYFRALENVKSKKKDVDTDNVKFESLEGGKFAQILHIGSYDDETLSVQKLHDHIRESGYQINGYHREVYLSDPRKVAEEKLKTILRYAVKEL